MKLVEHSPRENVNAIWEVLDLDKLVDYLKKQGFTPVDGVFRSEQLRLAKKRCFISIYKNGTVYVTGKQRSHGIALLRRVA